MSANERNPREEHVELLKAREDTPKPLQPAEQPLDFVAPLVHLPVVLPGSGSGAEGRNNRREPQRQCKLRVSLPSYARSINRYGFRPFNPRRANSLRPSGASWACPGERENVTAVRGIRGNHMNLGGPTASGFADGTGVRFFYRTGPIGMDLDNRAVQRIPPPA